MTFLQHFLFRMARWRKHSPVLHALGRTYMRACGCQVPVSCNISGLPMLHRNEGTVLLGERVCIQSIDALYRYGSSSKTKLSTGLHGTITIGDDTTINGASIFAEQRVDIGKRVMIAAGVNILDTSAHEVDTVPRRYSNSPVPQPVTIEDDVWITMDCIILPGVTIGKGSVIAAGSVVSTTIPPYMLAGGQPAKVIRKLRNAPV